MKVGQFKQIFGTDAEETLLGTTARDQIYGYGGNDKLYGQGGGDILYGGLGNDVVDGGTGADVMYGGAGDDLYRVDNPADIVSEQTVPGSTTAASIPWRARSLTRCLCSSRSWL
jgi:Ca2+-binding RTX toxin-like protein